MLEDAKLLRRYAEHRSQEAFAELVRRRVNLVYSVALRQVGGDVQLAEDVTQRVFTDLARKAASLADHTVLSGWLYRSAQFAASDVVRAERRRRGREQEAYAMNETLSANEPVDWETFRPVLDEALSELDAADRDAVALRFFEERSFAEVGAALRLNEDAARKRVARALDKLHGLLARRGVTSTTVALGTALAGQTSVAAPVGLAASVTGGALAGTAGVTGGGWIALMSISKLQFATAGALALASGTGYYLQAETNAGLRAEIAGLRAQQPELLALRAENQRLAAAAAEVEMLRRDDLEFQQLVQRGTDARKAMEEKARLAQAQNQRHSVQAEIDRMNREGNALVESYQAIAKRAEEPSLPEGAKVFLRKQMDQLMNEIRAKMAEVTAFKAANGLASVAEAQMWARRDAAPGPGEMRGEIRALQGPRPEAGNLEFRRKMPATAETPIPVQR